MGVGRNETCRRGRRPKSRPTFIKLSVLLCLPRRTSFFAVAAQCNARPHTRLNPQCLCLTPSFPASTRTPAETARRGLHGGLNGRGYPPAPRAPDPQPLRWRSRCLLSTGMCTGTYSTGTVRVSMPLLLPCWLCLMTGGASEVLLYADRAPLAL